MLDIYVDWACNYYYDFNKKEMNWNKSWWLWIVILQNNTIIKSISESYLNTTNQKMELLAIIRAIQLTEWDINIYSDSQYALNCSWKWKNTETNKYYSWWIDSWNKSNKLWSDEYKEDGTPILCNRYYIRELYSLISNRNINLFWVRWHNWNKYNEIADELSNNYLSDDNLLLCEYDDMEIEYLYNSRNCQ